MAISFEQVTYGLMNYWQKRMRVGAFLFNQTAALAIGGSLGTPGSTVYTQADRDNIGYGLLNAVSAIAEEFRFYPFPVYQAREVSIDPSKYLETQLIRLPHKRLIAVGDQALTLMQPDRPTVYTDSDGDGVTDLCTITATVPTGTLPGEIKVFFRVADGAYAAADPRFEIAPCTVTISGVTATIKTHKAYCTKLTVWGTPYTAPNFINSEKNIVSAADDTNFVAFVDVYREQTEPIGAVTLYVDPAYQSGDYTSTARATIEGGAIIHDPERGEVMLRNIDGGYTPGIRSASISYKSGYPLDRFGQIDNDMVEAIVRLANCRMPHDPTDSEDARVKVYAQDNGVEALENAAFIRPLEKAGIFGPKRGEIAAAKVLQGRRIMQRIGAVD